MEPLITPAEARELGALEDHAAIEELIERAWKARTDQFGDSTDMCSLVNAKSGGCAEDCGFCAQSRFAEAETPLHAMMEPDQILEHAKAAEAAGAHRFCMVTQGQGLSKRDFAKVLEGAKLVSEQTNLKRCASVGHMSVDRAKQLKEAGIQRIHHNVETAESYYPEVSSTVRYAGRLRTIDAVKEAGLETRRRDPQPRRDPRPACRDGFRAVEDQPDLGADQPAQPAPGHQVRRSRLHGSVGGDQVDRNLPLDPPGRAVPPLRRPRREHRRASGPRCEGRSQRRDDGQLPDDARLNARGRSRDVRRPRSEHQAPSRQRRQPAPDNRSGYLDGETPDVVEEFIDNAAQASDAGIKIELWDPATQLRYAAKKQVPERPDGAENRWPEGQEPDPEAAAMALPFGYSAAR